MSSNKLLARLHLTQDWNGLGRHYYSSWTPINAGGLKCSHYLSQFPGPLLKSGMGPLASFGNHQEIIGRRLEQMYTLSDTRLEWPGEGSLFESDSNKRQGPKRGHYSSHPRPFLKSGLQPLFRYGTHQTVSGRLEQVYLPSDPRLQWPGGGALFQLNLNKCWG